MTRPTAAAERETFEVEEHAATLGRMLQYLRVAMRNAVADGDERLVKFLHGEIEFYTRKYQEVKVRSERLHGQRRYWGK